MIFFRKRRIKSLLISHAIMSERILVLESLPENVYLNPIGFQMLLELRGHRAGVEEELSQLGHVNEAESVLKRIKEKA